MNRNKILLGKIIYSIVFMSSVVLLCTTEETIISAILTLLSFFAIVEVYRIEKEEDTENRELIKELNKINMMKFKKILKHRFYKDEEGWFIDLPEFINAGLGTKANLAMVCGADTLLDQLSEGKNEVIMTFSDEPFEGAEKLTKVGMGADINALEKYGHPIQFGAFYYSEERNHELWLCPVTVYVFNGYYPDNIYIKVA